MTKNIEKNVTIEKESNYTIIDSTNKMEMYQKCYSLIYENKYSEAFFIAKRLEKIEPITYRDYTLTGMLVDKLGKRDSAVLKYNLVIESINKIPKDSITVNTLVDKFSFFLLLEEKDKALQLLNNNILKNNPELSELHLEQYINMDRMELLNGFLLSKAD